tara:strand:- start:4514 stop:6283 length:1770 start_codon:yes stop_codon:yes gene_type:complete
MSSSDLRLVSFNKYVREPIKEYTYKGWVLNGINNSHNTYLIDRYYGSTTHSSICNSYVDLTLGKGLTVKDKDLESAETKAFLKIFPKKEHIKIITDYQIFEEVAFQVIKKGNKKLDKILHIDKDKVVPSVEDLEGNITSYWYSRNWKEQYLEKNKPVQYPAFGFGKKGETEIFVASPYKLGREYFKDPSYTAILPYAEFEEEVANYYLKYIKNGLSLGNIINVPNSGHWSDGEKDDFVKSVKQDHTGSEKANSLIVAFSSGEQPTTIESIKNEYAHKQWDFLTVEARQQILTGHKATSPSLVGVISSSGFASTADEMDTAEFQLMKRVISPKQNFIVDSLREILDYFGMDTELSFVPLTVKEVLKTPAEKEVIVETTDKLELNSDCGCGIEKKKSDLDLFLELGEDEDLETYNLINEIEVDYNEEIEFASTGTARPNSKSSQDSDDFIVRYRYVDANGKTKAKGGSGERNFCQKMLKANKVYRKEDILQLTNKVVNDFYTNKDGREVGWGAKGAKTYSIWLYKGGGNCHHKWNRVIYLKKGQNVDVNSPLAKIISTSEARRRGLNIKTNESKVSIAPKNMTNNGFLKPR